MHMRIGVLSDTHIPRRARVIPSEVFEGFSGVELIIHAGDLVSPEVLSELSVIAPVHAVYGNMDPPEVRQLLPRTRTVEVGDWRIGVVHGDGKAGTTVQRARRAFDEVHCVVFGHSHRPLCERQEDGVLLFNPGSPTDRRSSPWFSYGILTLSAAGVDGKVVYFS